MKKTILLAEATTPDGSKMTLHTHDGTYVIRVDGQELMSTRHFASEEKLAELACAKIKDRKSPRVLIGGLGLGFTLRSALAILPATATVVVAELMPAVVEWNKNPEYHLAATAMADKRTHILIADVAQVIAQNIEGFDAIMLDADNGTTAMSTAGNRRLYDEIGLTQVWAALKPGGTVVYWSAQAEPVFAKRMGKAGFTVDVQTARSHATSGGKHTLLIGHR